MEKYVKITLDGDYADEFSVKCFVVVNANAVDTVFPRVKNHKKAIELYFGSNEWLQYEDGEDLIDSLTVEEITTEEKDFFVKFFGENNPDYCGVLAHFGLADHFFEEMCNIAFPNPDDEDF